MRPRCSSYYMVGECKKKLNVSTSIISSLTGKSTLNSYFLKFMPSIIPKAYYCAVCKTESKAKTCKCGAKCKPVPPYTVRFRWINEKGEEEHKRLTGTPPWTSQNAAQKGYEQWIAAHPSHPKPELHTFDFMPLYAEYKTNLRATVKESSYMSMTQRFDKYIVPDFQDRKVTEITTSDLIKWQSALSEKGLSYRYKKSIREAFNNFFSYLKIYVIQNPFANVKGFKANKEAKKEMLFWTQEEFEQFIAQVDNFRFKCAFAFLYLTGCRKGEACALKWEDLNLNTSIITITKTLTRSFDKERANNEGEVLSDWYRITTPKTENSYRKILLPPILIDYLKELKGDAKETDFIFGTDGSFMPFQTLQHAFERYTKKAGVKQIRIHDLRHSHVSLLINKGENQLSTIYVIAARLGDSVEMIFKTYGHLFPSSQKEILEKINIKF